MPRRHTSTPRRATALVLAGLLLAALLTAPALADTARDQPYGPMRTVLVEATEVLASISQATRLDVPWHTLDEIVHGSSTPPAAGTPDDEPAVAAPPDAGPPTPAPTSTVRPSPTPTDRPSPAPTPTAATPAAPTPEADHRIPTADDPLRVWIAGDSMWERPGPPLVAALEATGVVDVVDLDFRYSTGLTRPDVFDWPAHARSRIAALQPEVVLFLVGPNDAQPLVADGVRHEPRTDGFLTAYTARVRSMMDALAEGTDQVLWVGLPIMRSTGFDERMAELDRIYATTAAAVEGVQHVPIRALFADDDGSYAAYLPGPDGTMRPMRNRDGIHLSSDGAERLARHLFDLLDARHTLTD